MQGPFREPSLEGLVEPLAEPLTFGPKRALAEGLSAYSVGLLGGLGLDPESLFLRGTSGKTF